MRCCIFALQAGRNVFCRAVFSFLHNGFMMKEASKFFSCFSRFSAQEEESGDFRYTIERFADMKVMRYRVPGWESLTLRQKCLLYYLGQAAGYGRDIFYDQNFRYNLLVKRVLENVYATYGGKRDCADFSNFVLYLKRFWFSNGIHHPYACDKFFPACPRAYMRELFRDSDLDPVFRDFLRDRDRLESEGLLEDAELLALDTRASWMDFLLKVIYDPDYAAKRVNLDPGKGLVESSSCHYYSGVSTLEAEAFYEEMKARDAAVRPEAVSEPRSYGLNTRLVKRDGKVFERICCKRGLYGKAIREICRNLESALAYAESAAQRSHLEKLIEYYSDGDLSKWDAFNILWVEDDRCFADYNNGFIETYGDPLGLKASWEALAAFRDEEATRRTETLCAHAQWFEDHSPVDARFRKKEVKGVSAKVITAVQLGGDCFPVPPVGINLPNADWIRHKHGSKSVRLENLCHAYDRSAKETGGLLEEFAWDEEEIARARAFASDGDRLHTDLHECLGHGSGRLLEGVDPDSLKNYGSALEEARADLFALYYMADKKLQDLGIVQDERIWKAEYDSYMRNGLLVQLARVEPGKDIEEAHMRARSLVARWVREKGEKEGIVQWRERDGKRFVHISDHARLRALFASLLAEIQRIKSEGDFEAGKNLMEAYGVKVDAGLHREVLARHRALDLALYGGFVNPEMELKKDGQGRIADVGISYPDDFAGQMMEYAGRYSVLPCLN